jgi:hypothetical protein
VNLPVPFADNQKQQPAKAEAETDPKTPRVAVVVAKISVLLQQIENKR